MKLTRCKVDAGMSFGKWSVLREGERKKIHRYWHCKCECGVVRDVAETSLLKGVSNSCGKCDSRIHGMTKSPEWESWVSMKTRCDNKNHQAYHRYGGRGITYTPAWGSFSGFFEDMGVRPEGTSLDRIDNEKGYSKENCRWATSKQQQRNKSNNRLVEYGGELYPVSALAEKLGVKVSTMFERVRNGIQLDLSPKARK